MIVTVLGAAGKTGRLLVQQALGTGDEVRALVRREGSLAAAPGLTVVVGDATDAEVIARVSRGTDVVISALGQGSGKSSLMIAAVTAIMAASQTTGVRRLVLLSGVMVKRDRLGPVIGLMARSAGATFADKARSEELLRTSDLEWTIVYPPLLTDRPLGSGIRIVPDSERIGLRHKVARADVAAWMLHEASANEHVRGEIVVSG